MSTELYFPSDTQPSFSSDLSRGANNLEPLTLSGCDKAQSSPDPYRVSPWSTSMWKRIFDLTCVLPTMILISPLLVVVAALIRCTSHGPIIFRQQRTGRNRQMFTIYKFRTMINNSEVDGPEHTAKGDPRITLVGRALRRFKLDELPQLYNVLRGDMSLVGPRPKLPHHEHMAMICRPGVTGAATLAFRREQHILCEVPVETMEMFYQGCVAPLKAKLDADFMSQETLVSDVCVLVTTVLQLGKYLTSQDLVVSSSQFRKYHGSVPSGILETYWNRI